MRHQIVRAAGGAAPSISDPDAAAYIAAVEAADGQALESGVGAAIDDFVVGCKSDGIWASIEVSCILAGARTLAGALVPLKGPAPTNVNFVSGDYNRLGLLGDGSSKYLDTNYETDTPPLFDYHVSAMAASPATNGDHIIADEGYAVAPTIISASGFMRSRNVNDSYSPGLAQVNANELIGLSRASDSNFQYIHNGVSGTHVQEGRTNIVQDNIYVFRRGYTTTNYCAARLNWYSAGTSINLVALDTRLDALMSAISTAIP